MANLSIGDKLLSSVSTRTDERGEKRPSPATEDSPQQDTRVHQDTLAVASGSPERLDRPLSRRIGDADEALNTVQQLKAQLQKQPGAAVAAHADIGQTQVYTLLHPLIT